jgi:HK97 gp10 family phage protein
MAAGAPKGLDRLLRQFKALPELQRRAAQESLVEGAEELAGAIKRAVPKRTGKLAGTVRVESDAGPDGLPIVKVIEGDKESPQGPWVEFGTAASPGGRSRDSKGKSRDNKRPHAATPAQPHFWPTVRAQKKRLKSRVMRNANKAAKAAAAIG